MSNDVVLRNNWEVFHLDDNQEHFNQVIDIVKQLDEGNVSTNLWTKWKNHSNQIVIETPNYYFKIYNDSKFNAEYNAHIREKLAEIYREDYHLLWNIKTIYQDDKLYQIEQREKLQVCNPNMMSIEDIFLNYNNTLKKLEKKLLLPQITKQISPKVKKLYQIKLIRECIPKYEDYAITKDGTIILLDDADWFLSMVDEEGEPFSIPNTYFEVISSFDYNSILCPCNWEELFEQNSDLGEIKKQASRWIISKPRPDILHLHTDLNDKYEMTINDTIKILSTDKKLENRSLYFDNPDIELLGSNLNKTKLLN